METDKKSSDRPPPWAIFVEIGNCNNTSSFYNDDRWVPPRLPQLARNERYTPPLLPLNPSSSETPLTAAQVAHYCKFIRLSVVEDLLKGAQSGSTNWYSWGLHALGSLRSGNLNNTFRSIQRISIEQLGSTLDNVHAAALHGGVGGEIQQPEKVRIVQIFVHAA